MITISVINAPEIAAFWNPTFWAEDYSEIASAGEFLPIWQGWGTPLIGPSEKVDLMVDLFATDKYPYTLVGEDHTGFINWRDNTNYTWNWATKKLEFKGGGIMWPLLAGAGVLAAVVVAKRQRK